MTGATLLLLPGRPEPAGTGSSRRSHLWLTASAALGDVRVLICPLGGGDPGPSIGPPATASAVLPRPPFTRDRLAELLAVPPAAAYAAATVPWSAGFWPLAPSLAAAVPDALVDGDAGRAPRRKAGDRPALPDRSDLQPGYGAAMRLLLACVALIAIHGQAMPQEAVLDQLAPLADDELSDLRGGLLFAGGIAFEFGAVVRLVKAAELLGFVQTPGQDVLLTPLGHEVVAGSTETQKRIVREQLCRLKIFELLLRLIKVQENQALPDEELLRELQIALPHEKPKPLFRTLLSWGRYTELISYDQRHHVIRLYEAGSRRSRSATPPPAATPPPPAA